MNNTQNKKASSVPSNEYKLKLYSISLFPGNLNQVKLSLKNMDEFYRRFPHLPEQIFEKLDDESVLSSRVVARSWKKFINDRDYPWIRIQNMVADLRKNCIDDGMTPKSFATPFQLTCGNGQVYKAKLIMRNHTKLGIELNTQNWFGFTAFHWACVNGHSNVVEMLMKNSAESVSYTHLTLPTNREV